MTYQGNQTFLVSRPYHPPPILQGRPLLLPPNLQDHSANYTPNPAHNACLSTPQICHPCLKYISQALEWKPGHCQRLFKSTRDNVAYAGPRGRQFAESSRGLGESRQVLIVDIGRETLGDSQYETGGFAACGRG